MSNALFSRKMPQKSLTSDNGNTFILGRKAFINKTYLSQQSENLASNLDYTSVNGKKSSNGYAKPLENKSADLRIQRIRLTTVGSGSTKLKNNDDKVSFVYDGADINFINTTLSRVRGGGCVAPKKKSISR